MRDAATLDRIGEGADHRVLADKLIEGLRAIFAGEDSVGGTGFRRCSGCRRGFTEHRRLALGLQLGCTQRLVLGDVGGGIGHARLM